MDKIEVRGYKSIKELSLSIRPINILIGANGSGKSNFLSLFEFLNYLYERRLKGYVSLNGGVDKFLHKGITNNNNLYCKIEFGANGYSFLLDKGEEHFVFSEENLWYSNNPFYENPVTIPNFSNEAKLKYNTTPRARYTREYLEGLVKYHFHDTGKNSPFNLPSNVENDVYMLYGNGENLAALLFRIKNERPKVYKRIVNNIQTIAPYFNDFYFSPNENNLIRLAWKDKYSNFTYGVTDLSDGTIRYIALAVLFMQPVLPKTIIIDEPELGLHPSAIANLVELIKSVANAGTQVIMATQSIDLINHFKPDDIITVDQIEGESTFSRLDGDNFKTWLEDYSLGTLWKNNIINSGQPQ